MHGREREKRMYEQRKGEYGYEQDGKLCADDKGADFGDQQITEQMNRLGLNTGNEGY